VLEVFIRNFSPGDLDALFVLDFRCYPPPYRFGYQQLLLTLQDRNVSAMVIENEMGADLIGGLILRSEPSRRRVVVVSLMVEPEFRRLGLGGRLLERAVRLARAASWEAVVVPMEQSNAAGAAFLAAGGFQPELESAPFFTSIEEGRLWRLSLGGSSGTPSK